MSNEQQNASVDPPLSVLIIDDERNIRSTLAMYLQSLGCEVESAATGDMALALIAQHSFDLAFLDLRLGQASGIDLLPRLLAENPNLSVVILTAYGTLGTAVEAIKRGATDFLAKPFAPEQIAQAVARANDRRNMQLRLLALDDALREAVPEIDLSTRSPKMQGVLDMVRRAASTDAAILLRGESGTGKTVIARALHLQSPRRDRPFVVVNCPTLSEDLLASELFGHVRGAFTGALRDQPGKVEAAQGGTIFLDEVGEIAPSIQAKLLRFLQDKEFERVGENKTRRADVRVVAATNRNLELDVTAGHFREDLLYRLNVVEVVVPPLRERPEDLQSLAKGFMAFFARSMGRAVPELSSEAENALLRYSWPGNVRELRNVLERALILWPSQVIEPLALPEKLQSVKKQPLQIGGDFTIEEIERQHILGVVARKDTAEEAAQTLGIDTSTLWRKRKKYEHS